MLLRRRVSNNRGMTITATDQMQDEVERVVREFSPDVVRIRFRRMEDTTGDPAIYFFTILSDEASRTERLKVVAPLVSGKLYRLVHQLEPDRLCYPHFRSESEQERIKELRWE